MRFLSILILLVLVGCSSPIESFEADIEEVLMEIDPVP